MKNQEIMGKFVNREVIYCVSSLVSELAKKADHFPEYTDELCDAFYGHPDYEEAARNAGWEEVDDGFVKDGEISGASDWKELCFEQNIDFDEYRPEIFEHWIVTEFLADKLESNGHKVLRDFFGMTVWCRPTTGQAILLDGVIHSICEGMGILEGQKYDWSK